MSDEKPEFDTELSEDEIVDAVTNALIDLGLLQARKTPAAESPALPFSTSGAAKSSGGRRTLIGAR